MFTVSDQAVRVGDVPSVYMVYAVRKSSQGKTMFLLYSGGWLWKDSKLFIPQVR